MCVKASDMKAIPKMVFVNVFKVFLRSLNKISKCSFHVLLWMLAAIYFLVVFMSSNESKDLDMYKTENTSHNISITVSSGGCAQIHRYNIKITKYPALVWWNAGYRGVSETLRCDKNTVCVAYKFGNKLPPDAEGAYLFYASCLNFTDLPLPRNPTKIIWALSHEESPKNVLELQHEKILSLFNFSSTFSRHSDVPFPLHDMHSLEDVVSGQYYVTTSAKNSHLIDLAPVLYIHSDCDTLDQRDKYVSELMKHIKIDSYGTCLKNKDLPKEMKIDYLNKLYSDNFLKFVARYKFTIAIENGVCDDYVTEKFWRPILVGSVPIYFGSPLIRDWLPNNKSAILLEDFPTPKLMSEYIKKLLQDDRLYEEHLEHKTKRIISNKKLVNEATSRPYQFFHELIGINFECFVCRKMYENRVKPGVNIMTKSHYPCPKPISALTFKVEPENDYVMYWEAYKYNSELLYREIMSS